MTGRTKGLNLDMMLKAVALTVTALVMFSCQKDPIDDGLVTIYPVIDNKIETAVLTRAAINANQYTEYTDANHGARQTLSVNAVAFQGGSTINRRSAQDANGVFAPLPAGGWRSGVKVEVSYAYKLYVYSNSMPSPSTQFIYDDNSNSAKLSFNGLYVLTTTDPLVCVAASAKELSATPDQDDYPTLNEGEYNIGTIPNVTTAGNSYKAFLAMDHFYSKATLSFRIDPGYNELRDIVIKDVKISTPQGTVTGTHTYTFSNNTINPADNAELGGDTITIDLFGDDADITTLNLNGATDYTLTTTLQEFGYFYFLPMNPLQPIRLTVTYDVLDRAGNVTRANRTVHNDYLFNSIKETAKRGFDYKLKITVGPTYLNQLSDDDVDMDLTIVQQ